MTVVEFVAVIATWFYLKRCNHKKELEKDTPEAAAKRQIDLDVIGEDHPGMVSALRHWKSLSLTYLLVRFPIYPIGRLLSVIFRLTAIINRYIICKVRISLAFFPRGTRLL